MTILIALSILSYLLGSIPFGYVLVKLFRGEDVRKSGSGNIGATNVSRKSPALGVATLLLDALKGAAAVVFAKLIGPHTPASQLDPLALAAFCAVLGHVFPIWLKFRGGKGVATALGAFAVIAPKAVLLAACIFLVSVAISRQVSLGSILSVAAFPLLAWFLGRPHPLPSTLVFMALSSLLIVAKHQQNILRLLAGTESRLGVKPA